MSMVAEPKNKKVNSQTEEVVEFVESLLKVSRVTKVIKGGRRLAFSALVAVGDRKGHVGIALGKGREVSAAISKAFKKARKNMVAVPLYKTTIPYTVEGRYGASKVLLRSASQGTGVIAGGTVRSIVGAVGINDILTKSLGSGNPQNVAKAVMNAFAKLRSADHLARLRGKTVQEIVEGKDVTA